MEPPVYNQILCGSGPIFPPRKSVKQSATKITMPPVAKFIQVVASGLLATAFNRPFIAC